MTSWFSQTPCESVKTPLERRHTEAPPLAAAGGMSLLDRLDGAWMGSGTLPSAGSHSERLLRRKGRSAQLPPADVRPPPPFCCPAAGVLSDCCHAYV